MILEAEIARTAAKYCLLKTIDLAEYERHSMTDIGNIDMNLHINLVGPQATLKRNCLDAKSIDSFRTERELPVA